MFKIWITYNPTRRRLQQSQVRIYITFYAFYVKMRPQTATDFNT